MRTHRLLRTVLIVIAAGAAPLAACSPSDGDGGGGDDSGTDGGGTDGGEETGVDSGADAADASVDVTTDGGADAADGGSEADAEAGADAGGDAGSDAGDGGTCSALYCGAANDFAVDSTNLYVVMPANTTIAKCPLAGCDAAGPTALVVNSNAVQIQAVDALTAGSPPTVYYGTVAFGPHAARIMSVSAAGGAPVSVWSYGGPPNIAFLGLRYSDRVLYGSVRGQGMGTPAFYIRARVLLDGAGAYWNEISGAPVFDVRGNYAVLYDDMPSGPPGNAGAFSSQQISNGVKTTYTVPSPRPRRVTVSSQLVAWRAADNSTYFCDRPTCAVPVLVAGVSSADIAMDGDYLYMATPEGVLRCATSEMNGARTCTTEVFAPTSGAALQLVLTSTNLYVRTAEPSIHGFAIP